MRFFVWKNMENEPTPQFTIRQAVPDDIKALRSMHAASWLATYPSDENGVSYDWVKNRTDAWLTDERLAESRQILANVLNDPTQFYRLAEQNGRVVGFVHGSTHEDGSKELEAIYTSPEVIGQGLGAQLMAEADNWFGDHAVDLAVITYNARAIRFYEKHGFSKVPNSEYLYADKMPAMRMARPGRVA